MRRALVLGLIALLGPAPALAQTAPAPPAGLTPPPAAAAPAATPTPSPSTTRAKGGDITREEYIQHAVDRARRAAETRFDRMDTNHDGVLTAEERRAARAHRHATSAQ